MGIIILVHKKKNYLFFKSLGAMHDGQMRSDRSENAGVSALGEFRLENNATIVNPDAMMPALFLTICNSPTDVLMPV